MDKHRNNEEDDNFGFFRREYIKIAGIASASIGSAGCVGSGTSAGGGSDAVRSGYGGVPVVAAGLTATGDQLPMPVGWWPFDEVDGTVARDTAGSLDGEINGDVRLGVSGATGSGSFDFRESDGNYVVVEDGETLRPPDQLTYGAWFRIDGDGVSQTLIQKADSLIGGVGYAADVQSGNSLRAHVGVDGGTARVNPWGIPTHDGEWHHLMLTWDGDALICYLDGEEVDRDESQSGGLRHSTNPLYVTRGDNGWSQRYELHGRVDDVRVYATALTAEEVAAVHDGLDGATGEEQTPTPTPTPADEREYGRFGYGEGGYGGTNN